MGNFKKLTVWQKSKELAVFVHKVIHSGVLVKDYCLRDQMWRAAVSIPSNIAEGDQLDSNQQSIKHFYIARGSSAELHTQAIIAREIKSLDDQQFQHIEQECNDIESMLTRLIKARVNQIKSVQSRK